MRALVSAMLMYAACSQSAEIGKGYSRALETMVDPPSKLDVVFVVDDSLSMLDDQQALVEAARTELFPQLRSMTGELPDLHLAVVSTSLDIDGWGSAATWGCADTPDGHFAMGGWGANNATPGTAVPPCTAVAGAYMTDAPDGSGGRSTNYTGTIEDAFACMATLGEKGCGIEQPLEALRRALTDPANAGFLRADAALLVVFLSDEDDDSGTDPTQWPAYDPYFPNDRWFEHGVVCDEDVGSAGPKTNCRPRDEPFAMSPIGPYITFLQSLKTDPALVMVAGIVPPPSPVNIIKYDDTLELDAACTPPGRSGVVPSIRLTTFMPVFPARYVLTSICDASMAERVHQIGGAISGIMTNRPCLLTEGPVSADRCRAFDVDSGGKRTPVSATFTEDPVMCDYTPSHLRADVSVATGHHVEVECLP